MTSQFDKTRGLQCAALQPVSRLHWAARRRPHSTSAAGCKEWKQHYEDKKLYGMGREKCSDYNFGSPELILTTTTTQQAVGTILKSTTIKLIAQVGPGMKSSPDCVDWWQFFRCLQLIVIRIRDIGCQVIVARRICELFLTLGTVAPLEGGF